MVRWRNPIRVLAQMSDVAKVCLATAGGALVIALLGTIFNFFVANWFQASGMAVVGLFYLVLFLVNYPPRGAAALGAAQILEPHPVERPEKNRRSEELHV